MSSVIEAMPGIKFGCDPELFVVDADGTFVCADGLIPGTKKNPHPVEFGAVQVDGMAAEFNIEPVTTFEEFRRNVTSVMRQLEDMLPNGYKLVVAPSATFTKEVWDAAPEHAKTLGCSPDFNAWTGGVNPPPEDLENPYLRTASGHLHFGWKDDDADLGDLQYITSCKDLVKQLDYYLGAWSLRIDKDANRRRLYGKAGAMRFKPYGVEYRVLSNFWLLNNYRMKQVWNRMNQAIWDMRNLYLPDMGFEFNSRLISSIDNSSRDRLLEDQFDFPIVRFKQG